MLPLANGMALNGHNYHLPGRATRLQAVRNSGTGRRKAAFSNGSARRPAEFGELARQKPVATRITALSPVLALKRRSEFDLR
jgi:hypothetical protein